jgi:ATP-binding cassette subfamily B protein
MAREGAYWRLYQAQLRRTESEDEGLSLSRSVEHSAHPAGNP